VKINLTSVSKGYRPSTMTGPKNFENHPSTPCQYFKDSSATITMMSTRCTLNGTLKNTTIYGELALTFSLATLFCIWLYSSHGKTSSHGERATSLTYGRTSKRHFLPASASTSRIYVFCENQPRMHAKTQSSGQADRKVMTLLTWSSPLMKTNIPRRRQ
jgi:hypothetical protein